ncbi:MAG: HAD-IC family P-type ATPase [Polyangiaceae bacterium]|nr:HAD-IC family P-type ATPase [Polyangiaceae bacterium]
MNARPSKASLFLQSILICDQPPWHAQPAAQVVAALHSSDHGLSQRDAAERLAQHGPNVLQHVASDGPLTILWRQINSPLIWVLIGSSALAVALGKVADGLVVLAVVILNSIIGFVQEYKASRAIDGLRDMVPQYASVKRDGRLVTTPVAELVPGDVITLASGDKVPADVRLLSIRNLNVEEAALTGESVPAEKSVASVAIDASLGDRYSMAYGGTLVTCGTATAVVVTTGQRTELGRISKMLQQAADLETPMTKALGWLATVITIAILVVSAIILGFGVFRATQAGVELGLALRETLVFAIALAVGAIPEGLPAIVTIALAIGVQRMAQRRAIIRMLPAVETLGSTTVICSDKTGTLTRNEMTVQAMWTPQDGLIRVEGVGYEPTGSFLMDGVKVEAPASAHQLLEDAALCNDATLTGEAGRWTITGDPTEGALVVAAEKAGMNVRALRERVRRVDAIPFESENQFMATLHDVGRQRRIVLKGAPEVVLKHCRTGEATPREAEARMQLDALTEQGMRVLAVARKGWAEAGDDLCEEHVREGFTLGGLIGMIDPPRVEAIDAIRACEAAGIFVKMITGDHKGTAQAIGGQLKLNVAQGALEGKSLSRMTSQELRKAAVQTAVFARVAPEHKMMLVKALQKEGHVVAMTGDGVNDAPALKQANIGVAMGITGTSVAKESSDVVLTDDNFATIVAAVEEGRRVYDNLVKSLAFVLPTNLGLAFILMYAVLFLPFDPLKKALLVPIQPTQLLWLNLVGAVALSLPLAFEAKEPNVMQRPPRSPTEPILSKLVVRRTVLASIMMTIGAVVLFQWAYDAHYSLAKAQTMAVTSVIMFQVFYMLNSRSLRDSVFQIGVFSNPWVFVGIGITLVLQLAFIYTPPLQLVFDTAPLGLMDFGISTLAGVITLPFMALEKLLSRKLGGRHRGAGAGALKPEPRQLESNAH